MQRGFSAIIVLVALVAMIVVAGGLFYTGRLTAPKLPSQEEVINIRPESDTKSIQPSPVSKVPEPPKTYKSAYGYSFQYPADWAAEDSLGSKGVVVWSKPEYIQLSEEQQQGFNKEDYATIEVGMYLNGSKVADNSDPTGTKLQTVNKDTNVKEFVSKLYGSIVQSYEDTTLGGKPAVLVVYKRMVMKSGIAPNIQNCPPEMEPCQIQDGIVKGIWTNFNGDILFLGYHYQRQYPDSGALPSIFNDVVASFRFTQ